jgi:hypothetical protein
MFQLTGDEVAGLNRSQIVTGSQKHRDPRFRPYAFSEQGVAMLSSVLRSKQAVAVNIEIMRAFVHLREILASNRELAGKLSELQARLCTKSPFLVRVSGRLIIAQRFIAGISSDFER